MNLTADFQTLCDKILQGSGKQRSILSLQKRPTKFYVESVDLRGELHALTRYLKALWNPYLRVPPTDQAVYPTLPPLMQVFHFTERERNSLDQCLSSEIDKLQRKIKALGTETEFESQVVSILLASCTELKQRLVRMFQQRTSISKPKSTGLSKQVYLADDDEKEIAEIPAEQLRELELENRDLVELLDGDLEQLRMATQTISQVSEMQSTIAMHLSMQSESINIIGRNVEESKIRVEQGNRHLKKAQELFGGPKNWVLIFFISLSILLLAFDYLYS